MPIFTNAQLTGSLPHLACLPTTAPNDYTTAWKCQDANWEAQAGEIPVQPSPADSHCSLPSADQAKAASDGGQGHSDKSARLPPVQPSFAVLVPCRSALKGKFPLHGTYFQTNEVFLDSLSVYSCTFQVCCSVPYRLANHYFLLDEVTLKMLVTRRRIL